MIEVSASHLIPYTIIALFGISFIMGICLKLERHPTRVIGILEFVGDNTLTILTWHLPTFVLVNYCILLIQDSDMARLCEFPVLYGFTHTAWVVIYVFMALAISMTFSYLNKYININMLKL